MLKNNIKKLREEKGITQIKFAELTELSVGYICHLEKGTRNNPSYNTRKKIAKALDKKISEIFDIEN